MILVPVSFRFPNQNRLPGWLCLDAVHLWLLHSGYHTCPCMQINIYKSLQDIAAGMDYLHTVGVLHGDLKGANVLLKSTATDPRGFMCKLADFGLSRVLDLDMTHISTHTYGTISYMPPELLSQGKMTRACDVYSFGMLSEYHATLHPCAVWQSEPAAAHTGLMRLCAECLCVRLHCFSICLYERPHYKQPFSLPCGLEGL